MASSSYYREMYRKKRDEVDDYEDDLKDLNKILESLSFDLPAEVIDVNFELDGLKADLLKGVRHNSLFTNRANAFENKKEKSIGQDRDMSTTQNAIEDEVARVTNLRSQAISSRDYYYDKYQEKKSEERAELLKNIFGG
ncbi:hypothetical protein [Niallia sp. Krafla_26]|uniref:hypothetical protein n=1 Tax=Niallia sp. Krafla_26 TaxID=3064703 RepID=UPI003D17183F